MFTSVPVLDIFLIDLEPSADQFQKNTSKGLKAVSKVAGGMALKSVSLIVGGPLSMYATVHGLKTLGNDVTSLKRLIDEKRFNIIKTKTELAEYENASGNNWVFNEKKLKQKQYYIRHPKRNNRNVLIEAKSFYSYIEEEQKDEIINFIMSHCPVKAIQIDRTEVIETSGHAKANIKGADISGTAGVGQMRGNYYNINLPNGAPKIEPHEKYFWIDKSIMHSISALTEGGSMTQTYESDFTFGLSIGEAKTIGLDLNKHKKYSYTLHIMC